MSDPDFQPHQHGDRAMKISELSYDRVRVAQAEMPAKILRQSLKKGLTPGYVYGTDKGHNSGPVFEARPNDEPNPSHTSYGNAYFRVFSS